MGETKYTANDVSEAISAVTDPESRYALRRLLDFVTQPVPVMLSPGGLATSRDVGWYAPVDALAHPTREGAIALWREARIAELRAEDGR